MKATRPHIIVATTAYLPLIGGAEIATAEIIKRGQEHFRFTIITARLDKKLAATEDLPTGKIIRVGWGSGFDKIWLLVALPWQVFKIKLADSVDLVWAVMASYAGAAAWITRLVCSTPYALTLQEGDDLVQLEKKLGFWQRPFAWIFQAAKAVQVIAPFLGDWARHFGATAPITVIANGVDQQQFVSSTTEKEEWNKTVRAELKISSESQIILSVSRLVEKNGLDILIAAAAQIKNCELIIVGTGVDEKKLKEQARLVGVRAHFVGTKSAAEIKRYAAAAQLFCRPSRSEGQGIVFLEAMCLGLPVVATRVGGIPSIIDHGKNGWLVEPNNPAALARGLQQVLQDKVLAAKLVAGGQENVAKFSWDKLAPQIISWLRSAMV